jgi:hypothetical protein
MRTSFHHQPEAQHPNFPLSTSGQADYPIFCSESGDKADITGLRVRATSGLMHCSKQHLYLITSSARASNVAGTSRPSARAVLRLMTSFVLGRRLHRQVGLALPQRFRNLRHRMRVRFLLHELIGGNLLRSPERNDGPGINHSAINACAPTGTGHARLRIASGRVACRFLCRRAASASGCR